MTLATDLDGYLRRTKMPPSRLGRAACNDPNVVQSALDGKRVGPTRERRLRDFMQTHPDGAGTLQQDPHAYMVVREGGQMPLINPRSVQQGRRARTPASGLVPHVPLSRIKAKDGDIAQEILREASRLGTSMDAFLADLVLMGWRCHVEDMQEAGA